MLSNKTTIFLFLVSWGLMFNDDYYKPVTLLNVTIYIDKGKNHDNLYVVFIRGELSFTEHSLQYYFFDKLQLTNVRLTRPVKDEHIETFADLKELLEQLVANEDKMKKIREKARVTIRPLVYRFKSKDGNQKREEVDLMKFEMKLGRGIFATNNSEYGAFVLFGNYFQREDTGVSVPVTSFTVHSYMNIFVQRAIGPTTADIDSEQQVTPMALAITYDDHTLPEITTGEFSKFDFLKKDGVWVRPYLPKNMSGTSSWATSEIPENSNESESLKLLEQIFSSEGEATTTTPALFANFMMDTFYYKFIDLIKYNTIQINKFDEILYENSQGGVPVTFEDIHDDPELEESMREKYNVVGELKASFNDDVFLTSVNPFTKYEYEPTTTSTEKSSSISTNKKEGMSGGMIALILIPVLVALVAIGVLGWYYFVQIRGKTSKRGRKLGK